MIYLLDTNTCITYLRKHLAPLAQKIVAMPSSDMAISVITAMELYRGAHLSAKVADNLAQVNVFVANLHCLPLDVIAAEFAGRIDADLTKQGLRIGPYDTLIAAIALANSLTLVTHNTREFSRVIGLHLEDWEVSP